MRRECYRSTRNNTDKAAYTDKIGRKWKKFNYNDSPYQITIIDTNLIILNYKLFTTLNTVNMWFYLFYFR